MTFREAEDHLLGLELFGMKFGLERMHRLMSALGLPQRRFASIHVVGSNGKSSTVRFAAAILQREGLRTGSYTSPHLASFRERIEVGEEQVSEERFAEAVERTVGLVEDVTQFEALTAAAYHELAARGVEVAVIEAGLGGRFDATNVIPSKLAVLTGVGLEHTRWLGPTIGDIAGEKLDVVRHHGTLLVPSDLHPDALEVAERVAAERYARLVTADLPGGPFQRRNFALARAAAAEFLGREPDLEAVESALRDTRIPGRLDVVGESPLTVHDGAHNPAGAQALAEALPEVLDGRRPAVLVASVLDDKDAAGMLSALLPLFDGAIFTRCANPRALSPATLGSLAAKLEGPPSETVAEPRAAIERAQEIAGPDGAVVATGSIYLIADLVRGEGRNRASRL
jgi:dihydrofolate synthase/folylpolyglutamate synthase